MSCTLSHESRVMLSSLLTASTDATRVWLRAEMDRTVDPMLHSIFNRLKTKLTNGIEGTQSVDYGDSKSQLVSIKEEFETMPSGQIRSSSFASDSDEQSNLTNQHLNNEHLSDYLNISELNCANGHLLNDDENENGHDSLHWIKVEEVDKESSRPVKKPRMDTTQPNNAQPKPNDETQSNVDASQNEKSDQMGSEQSAAIDTQANIDHVQYNSEESIHQEEMDANNAIGEESIATECTTNPIQSNLAQPNVHLQCPHCLKLSRSRYDLNTHLRVHTGERPFHCNQCVRRFSQRSDLTRHQLIHQNTKNFHCPECDKQFTLKQNLDSHLLTHSGERPFACSYCEKSFTESGNRNKHEQAIHQHVKPYRCKQCAHTATHRSHIIRHVRVVHFGLPKSIKQQRALNIIDDRDPGELVEKV